MLRPHSSLSNAQAIGRKKYILTKSSIVLAGIIGFMVQVWLFFIEYFSYPTSVEIAFQNAWEMQFPGITVCNNNRVKYSAWCEYDEKACKTLTMWRKLSQMVSHQTKLTIPQLISKWIWVSPHQDSTKTGFPFFKESEIEDAVRKLYDRLNRETRQHLGIKPEEFIVRCEYDDQNCLQE